MVVINCLQRLCDARALHTHTHHSPERVRESLCSFNMKYGQKCQHLSQKLLQFINDNRWKGFDLEVLTSFSPPTKWHLSTRCCSSIEFQTTKTRNCNQIGQCWHRLEKKKKWTREQESKAKESFDMRYWCLNDWYELQSSDCCLFQFIFFRFVPCRKRSLLLSWLSFLFIFFCIFMLCFVFSVSAFIYKFIYAI